MLKKLFFTCLWVVVLSLLAGVTTVGVFIVSTHGNSDPRPYAERRQAVGHLGRTVSLAAMPVALLLCVFGVLPGTRLKEAQRATSKPLKWIYRGATVAALCGMLFSLSGFDDFGDILTLVALGIAITAAGFEAYMRRKHPLLQRELETHSEDEYERL